jgi:polar amino acid transport system substrate-binding protein
MKPVLIATTLAIFSLTRLACADDAVIRIATERAYPPFNYMQPDGSIAGLDVDMANALCAEMKAKCTIVA